MPTFQPGDRFQHYVVGRLLGRGFHGEVHEITHPHTGDRFALKTMHLGNAGDARAIRRALVEAKGAYGIEHANVVTVHDFNCEDDGLVWMRQELLEGETLAELLGRLGRMSPLFALGAAIDAAHGLSAAHEAQIIHRDVKPGNLFHVRPTRSIKLIDFSIAKVFPEGLDTTMGRAGMGTPAFMSPDQLEGALPTPAFDVYALGLSLWTLLAGRHPFQEVLHDAREMIHRQFSAMPPLLSEVARLPPEIDAVVRRAVAKDPAARFASMKEMAQALSALRAWLLGEVAAGRLQLRVPPGEPPLPADVHRRHDYTPPRALPRAEHPALATPARVLVPEAATAAPAAPEPPAPAPEPPAPAPALPAPTPPPRRAARKTPWQPMPPALDLPTAVTRPDAVRAARRAPWMVAALVIALASLSTAALLGWTHARGPLPSATDPQPGEHR
jgi:serine/threonine-protein kinase